MTEEADVSMAVGRVTPDLGNPMQQQRVTKIGAKLK